MFRLSLFMGFLAACGAVCAADPHPSLPKSIIPDSLGVNIHFTDPRPGEFEMITAAGFKWVRMDLTWATTERTKGVYDFSAYDRLSSALEKYKLHAVFVLDYGNALYADPGDTMPFTSRAQTPEFRAAYGKWAVAAARHFKGRGYLWEMWNEPNGRFWKSADKTGDYIALAKATGEALRQAGLLGPKGEAFIGPAASTMDLPFLEACCKGGLLDYWDAVSVHPYRGSTPEGATEGYRSLRLLIQKYSPKDKAIPIISGEWGYSSAWKGFDEEKQARYLTREFLTNITNGIVLSIWYDWHDEGTNPTDGEHHFGLVHQDYHAGRDPVFDPKPAYLAARALMSPAVTLLVQHGALIGPSASETTLSLPRGTIPITNWSEGVTKLVAEGDGKVELRQTVTPAAPPGNDPPPGREILKISYKFGAGSRFMRLSNHAPIPALPIEGEANENLGPLRLAWWIYGDGAGCTPRVRFVDATGQNFQADGQKITWKGWRYVTFPLRSSENDPLFHWSAANDGVVHYPIKWDSMFLLDNPAKTAIEGEIYLSSPTLLY